MHLTPRSFCLSSITAPTVQTPGTPAAAQAAQRGLSGQEALKHLCALKHCFSDAPRNPPRRQQGGCGCRSRRLALLTNQLCHVPASASGPEAAHAGPGPHPHSGRKDRGADQKMPSSGHLHNSHCCAAYMVPAPASPCSWAPGPRLEAQPSTPDGAFPIVKPASVMSLPLIPTPNCL